MSRHFLTDFSRLGRTTIIFKIIERLKIEGIKVGGMITLEEKENQKLKGFQILDIVTGDKVRIAILEQNEKENIDPVVTIGTKQYKILKKNIDKVCVNSLKKAFLDADIIICDGIGQIEMVSEEFRIIVKELLQSKKPVIGTIQSHKLIHNISDKEVFIYKVTRENVTYLPLHITSEILREIKK